MELDAIEVKNGKTSFLFTANTSEIKLMVKEAELSNTTVNVFNDSLWQIDFGKIELLFYKFN